MKLVSKDAIEELIRGQHPSEVDYWLHGKRRRHKPITLTVQCPRCGHQVAITVKNRTELGRLLKCECPGCDALDRTKNAHLDVPMPFGKHRGRTINAVMEEEPSDLAWFVDQVKGEDGWVEQIKSHTRFPEVWAKYVEKQAAIRPKEMREDREWREGRFSQRTIDELCDSLFTDGLIAECRGVKHNNERVDVWENVRPH